MKTAAVEEMSDFQGKKQEGVSEETPIVCKDPLLEKTSPDYEKIPSRLKEEMEENMLLDVVFIPTVRLHRLGLYKNISIILFIDP